MKKALSGGLVGLLIGCAIALFLGWNQGIISFNLFPPRIEGFEPTPQAALMLFQCLLTGAIAGVVTYLTGRWGLGVVSGILVGFGLGFSFVGQADQPWDTILALGMLLPVMFVGELSSLAVAVFRMRESWSKKGNPDGKAESKPQ